MQKTIRRGKKALSAFLAVLMVLSAWVFVAPAGAADGEVTNHEYVVKVYGRIFDSAKYIILVSSGEYDYAYGDNLVTDPDDEAYGKPAGYKWSNDTNTNKINTAGYTLFYY